MIPYRIVLHFQQQQQHPATVAEREKININNNVFKTISYNIIIIIVMSMSFVDIF
jgi:hypothetical protein